MTFRLPIASLPDDVHERYQILHDYFCDQRATSVRNNESWIVEPYWPNDPEYFADPKILQGIQWWDRNLQLSSIHYEVRNLSGFQLALNDSWTLYSWSKWLAQKIRQGIKPKEVIILHIDYHNDLMSPRIAVEQSGYKDLMSKEKVNVESPETVRNAILSGAIGVGSFMVPFLHAISKIHVRHLCEGSRLVKEGSSDKKLIRGFEFDSLLETDQKRPSIGFSENFDSSNDGTDIYYRITSSLDELLSGLPKAPVLLHIDMDYFNCKYDGDTDWENHLPRYDPSEHDIVDKIISITKALKVSGVSRNIEDISVALSPGFFPVELWESGIQEISKMVQSLRMK